MPKVSDEYREARRRQIVEAAVRQILRRGVHTTTLADITAESGLSAGAIYTHFASKDEIIAHVATTAVDAVLNDVDRAIEADPLPSPAELLAHVTVGIPKAGVDMRLIVQLWGEAITNPVVRSIANRIFDRVRDAFREYFTLWLTRSQGLDVRRARERAAPLARSLITLIYSYIVQASLLDDFDPVTFIADIEPLIGGDRSPAREDADRRL